MKYIYSLAFLLFSTLMISQSTLYRRAKIDLKNKDINELAKIGVETDHGKFVPFRSLENDYSVEELELISEAGFEYEIVINDVVSHYQNPDRPSELNVSFFRSGGCDQEELCQVTDFAIPSNYSGGSMGGYKTYAEMIANLDSMALLYPNLITNRIDIDSSTTLDGNTIFYMKISDNPGNDEAEPQVLYTALHHAREPNGMAQMLFFMWYVLENYDTDPEIRAMVDNTELYFIPCVNPDGYMLNELNNPSGGGLWRKNTRRDTLGQLHGVDLNRNYGFFWGVDNNGSSPNPASQTYRGSEPFSEVETSAVKRFCDSKEIRIALNYHTYGNLLIHPWGFNDQPTEEDRLFKAMGNEMIHENCYRMGTGTETVGYVVNGDSDDWMYGEETTKPKIYAMTPEVGPSFWPAHTDIIALNRGTMAMNIATAQLATNLYEYNNITNSPLTPSTSQLEFSVSKIGLGEGPATITLEAVSNNITIQNGTQVIDVNPTEQQTLAFDIEFGADIETFDAVEVLIKVEGQGYVKDDIYTFDYLDNELNTVLEDISESLDHWVPTVDWNVTQEEVIEQAFSLTDSPNKEYRRNLYSTFTLKDTLDLSNVVYAAITFAAKWDIENDYDYVVLEASADGDTFEPLCGNYTNSGTSDQMEGQPLYDNVQLDWVRESSSLENFVGEEQVIVRFSLITDGFREEDGIYIDDIKVETVEKTISNVSDQALADVKVFPNPASDRIYISGLDGNDFVAKIYDATGRLIIQQASIIDIDISELHAGLHILELSTSNAKTVKKFIKE